MVHHGIDTPHLHPPPSRGRYGGGGLLRLKWIDKGLDVRYLRYCYMAYTEVRSQRSEVGLQTLEFLTSDFRHLISVEVPRLDRDLFWRVMLHNKKLNKVI